MISELRSRIPDEDFNQIVDAIEARAQSFLQREARIGQSSHVTGKARIHRVELNQRLVRVHNHLNEFIAEVTDTLEESGKDSEVKHWFSLLNTAEKSLENKRIPRVQQKKLWAHLIQLLEALEETITLLEQEIPNACAKVAPDIPLELLTPEEVETAFQNVSNAPRLANLLRADRGLRGAQAEVMALIKGAYSGPTMKGGPYEQRRGRWIAAFLLGMAEGLGLQPTRNIIPQQDSKLHSAADAVAIAIGQLQAAIHTEPDGSNKAEIWRTDPAAIAVLRELPRNRGANFNAEATAENIIRKIA